MIIEDFGEIRENSLWIRVKNLSVHVIQTDDGVVVDIYPLDYENDDPPITSTFAFFNEGIVEE